MNMQNEAIRRLVTMGFAAHCVRQALEAVQYNEEHAIDLLLSNDSMSSRNRNQNRMAMDSKPSSIHSNNTKLDAGTSTTTNTKTFDPPPHQSSSWGAASKVTTLRTMGPQYQYDTNQPQKDIPVQHIPPLSQADTAKAILHRIKSEFEPIIRRRGYQVHSITEMCCCSDGLDHCPHTFSNRNHRKTKIMPDNVLGYNLTMGYRRQRNKDGPSSSSSSSSSSTHRIHLRLRYPPSAGSWNHHTLYDYEHIAGTMCHELAHCVHGNHDAQFYKLMDEIMEEHSLLLVRGIVHSSSTSSSSDTNTKSENHWSSVLGPGYTLGGGTKGSSSSNRSNALPSSKRNVLAQAAMGRFHPNSDIPTHNDTQQQDTTLQSFLTPREAARIAAESRWMERQRIDAQFCLPCHEIIEILDEEEDEESLFPKKNDHPIIIEIIEDE